MDFNYMSNLAKTDIDKFNQIKNELINNFMETCNPKNKLKYLALQAKIDKICRVNTPINSCAIIGNMMWGSFEKLNNKYIEFINYAKENNKI